MTAGTGPAALAIDPGGKFLYVANFTSNNVSAYSINATTGALTAIGLPTIAGTNPRGGAVDPTGQFLYVANLGSSNVSAYSINATSGALISLGAPVASAANPFSLTAIRRVGP